MTSDEHNAAHPVPMPDKDSELPSAQPFDEGDIASEIAEVLRSAAVPASSREHAEDSDANLQEHLAALVEALATEQTGEAASIDDEERDGELELSGVTEQGPPEAPVELDDSVHDAGMAEIPSGEAEVLPPLAATESNVAQRRVVGFAAGLAASVAVGGGVLLLEIGISKPPAAAVGETPKFQSRLADASGVAVSATDAAQPKEIPRADVAAEEEREGASSAEHFASAVEIASRPEDLLLRAALYPAPPANRGDSDTVQLMSGGSFVSVPGVTFSGQREENVEPERPASAEVAQFETTIEPVEAETAIPAADEQPSTESTPIETAANAYSQLAHVVMHVNMRAGPSNGHPVLSIVPEGSPVEIINCGAWCQVSFGGQEGWIYRDFISMAGPNEASIN